VRKRKQRPEEHDNRDRWLVSYADFITLLFAFFVVMYAISTVDQRRVQQVQQSVRWALHVAGEGKSGELRVFPKTPRAGAPEVSVIEKLHPLSGPAHLERMRQSLERRLGRGGGRPGAPAPVLVQIDGRRLVVRVAAFALFDRGSAVLAPGALPTLDGLLAELAKASLPVRIEAFADDAAKSSDNWTLASARAGAVARYVAASGALPSKLLTVVAHGEAGLGESPQRVDFVLELDEGSTR
jgi:chemotaxis protein MotB